MAEEHVAQGKNGADRGAVGRRARVGLGLRRVCLVHLDAHGVRLVSAHADEVVRRRWVSLAEDLGVRGERRAARKHRQAGARAAAMQHEQACRWRWHELTLLDQCAPSSVALRFTTSRPTTVRPPTMPRAAKASFTCSSISDLSRSLSTTMGAAATSVEGSTRIQGNSRRANVSFCFLKTRRRKASWQISRVVDWFHPRMSVCPDVATCGRVEAKE